jgi:hypothetical protein
MIDGLPVLRLAVILVAVVACRSAPRESVALDPRDLGTFAYRMHLDGRDERGRFTIALDTIAIDPESGVCRPLESSADRRYFRFTCTEIGAYTWIHISIDTRDPRRHTSWSGARRVTRQRQVCLQYTTNASGQRICSRYGNENYDAIITSGGLLEVRPAASS